MGVIWNKLEPFAVEIGNAHKMKSKGTVKLHSFSNVIPHMESSELLSIRLAQILTSTGTDLFPWFSSV